jgi:hypothetical protein
MREWSLEQEFEIYKERHKTTMVQAKMITHYRDLQQTGVQIPDFMQVPPEKLAERDILELVCRKPLIFESLYNIAWEEYAECLP